MLINIDFKGVTYKKFYFEYPANIEKWMRFNMNNPSHGLFVDIVSFSEFFGNESYINCNKTMNELYMSDKVICGNKEDSIVGTYSQNILPAPYGNFGNGSFGVYICHSLS